VSAGPSEPPRDGPSGPGRWVGYLDWLREEAIGQVLSLPPQEQRTARLPSGWTPIEMLSHLLHMERRWFVWGFLGEPVDQPWGDWDIPEPRVADVREGARPEPRWAVADHVTAEHLVDRLRAVGARTEGIVVGHPLETRAATGGRFGDDPPTLEWICFHVLAEYARHAGHLDVVTELSRG
jgi:hypothetical protein